MEFNNCDRYYTQYNLQDFTGVKLKSDRIYHDCISDISSTNKKGSE